MTEGTKRKSPKEQARRHRLRTEILTDERSGGGCGQWLADAERWAFELGDVEAAKRCLRQAEPMAIPAMYGEAELEALFKRADMEGLAPFVSLPVPKPWLL